MSEIATNQRLMVTRFLSNHRFQIKVQRGTCEGSHEPAHIHRAVAVLYSCQEIPGLHMEVEFVHDKKIIALFYVRGNNRKDHSLRTHITNRDQDFDHRIMCLWHIDRLVIRCPRHQCFQHLHPRLHLRVRLRQRLLCLLRPHLQTCQISFLTS